MPWIRAHLAATLMVGPAVVWGIMAANLPAQTNSSNQPRNENQTSQRRNQQPSDQQPSAEQRSTQGERARQDESARPARDASTSEQPNFGAQFRRGENGLMISTVQEDGFFHNAGIHEGDRIISIDGHKVATEEEFRRFVRGGHGRVPVVVMRNGERREIMLNVDDLHAQAAHAGGDANRAALGIWFFSFPEGAYVAHVLPSSPAARAGVRVGDWIVSVNGAPCNDGQAMTHEVGQGEPNRTADLEVNRNGEMVRMQARLGAYDNVFANAEDWNTIQSRYQQYGMPRASGAPGQAENRYWTGERASGARERSNDGDRQDLERRVRQLEQEVQRLRDELQRGGATGGPAERPETGRRTSSPNGQ